MRYDWREALHAPVGTKAYFEEIDFRFLASVYKYMPWKNVPFETLIRFNGLADRDVLVGKPNLEGTDLEKAKLIFISDLFEFHNASFVAAEDQRVSLVDRDHFRVETFLQLFAGLLDLASYVIATTVFLTVLEDGHAAIPGVETRRLDRSDADPGAQ